MPATFVTPPGVATSTQSYWWIIAVAVGAYVAILIVGTCLFWRWQAGAPKRKAISEFIELPEKKPPTTNAVSSCFVFKETLNIYLCNDDDGAKLYQAVCN